MSINPPDFQLQKNSSIATEEDLSINDIESIYEMVAEGFFDNDVPESSEDETDTSSPAFQLYFFTRTCTQLLVPDFSNVYGSYYHQYFYSTDQEPHSPPPKFT